MLSCHHSRLFRPGCTQGRPRSRGSLHRLRRIVRARGLALAGRRNHLGADQTVAAFPRRRDEAGDRGDDVAEWQDQDVYRRGIDRRHGDHRRPAVSPLQPPVPQRRRGNRDADVRRPHQPGPCAAWLWILRLLHRPVLVRQPGLHTSGLSRSRVCRRFVSVRRARGHFERPRADPVHGCRRQLHGHDEGHHRHLLSERPPSGSPCHRCPPGQPLPVLQRIGWGGHAIERRLRERVVGMRLASVGRRAHGAVPPAAVARAAPAARDQPGARHAAVSEPVGRSDQSASRDGRHAGQRHVPDLGVHSGTGNKRCGEMAVSRDSTSR